MDQNEAISNAMRLAEDGFYRLKSLQERMQSPYFDEELYEAWDKIQAAGKTLEAIIKR